MVLETPVGPRGATRRRRDLLRSTGYETTASAFLNAVLPTRFFVELLSRIADELSAPAHHQ